MSRPAIEEYIRPGSLEEAWSFVAGGDPAIRILSGGADLTIHAPPTVTTLVDIRRAVGSSVEVQSDGSIHIGAMTTLTEVMEHPAVAAHGTGVVPEMMVHVGNPLLRNYSTIGGHVARGKWSDVVPVLLALDAEIELFNGEHRSESLETYYEQGSHEKPHIVTALRLPAIEAPAAAAFLRFSRTAFDFAILNVACRADGSVDSIETARVIVGATPRTAQRSAGAEAHIMANGLDEDSVEQAAAIAKDETWVGGGWVASAEYRAHLVEVLTRRCLTAVRERLI